ncbi:NAD(P)-dependent dehydrogenase (short-subunit alcohol dehydrogenase family) [Silvibacterium bohemicum]|uniref:NAD(P)-dependent dehydrogenase (Short-subunit alcohol dehydrogenase family) n=1 Tax=Silvibacterium bohemicum TaxID=1577686 RepID=A0A841JXB0_9BACT|nr:SDR family oxidoreductase [Silvibacterium bohemicum]MBB6143078.1 NAD(P)-dependent dehydrogenase (short-subunit alcohol dehydrogenase family) [Silvibacterium bohemicum]
MQRDLTVVITGASAGLGRAIAYEFGKVGARVGLISRDLSALEATAAEVEHLGGRAATYAADVSNDQAVEAAAASFAERLGPIDIWINNAMVSVFSPIKEMEAAEFRRVTEVNYLGYVYGTLAALRRMLPRNRGRIIQVGSALAVRSIPLQSAYCASKHAIVGFTDSLRCELIHDRSKVKAIVVHMPAMNTPQFTWVKNRLPNLPQPVPPIYEPEVGARVILHAALTSSPRREYWVGGSTVKAIFGQKFIPGLLDLYLGKTGYKAQQREEPDSPNRPNNVWHPVATKLGAHGPFDAKSRTFSLEAQVSKHRGWFVLGCGLGCGLLGAALCARKYLTR